MVATWPDDLPCLALRDGYTETLPDGRLATDMETGPPKIRQRFSSQAAPLPVTFLLSLDGKARLSRFWKEEIKKGSLPFWLRDQSEDGFPIAADDGSALLTDDDAPILMESWILVMFGKSAPAFSRVGASHYRASLQLIVMP